MTDLQLCITLSQRCMAAFARGETGEACDLMGERDAVYKRLGRVDARSFSAWAAHEFTSEQVAAFLETGDRSHIAMTKGDFATVAELADDLARAVASGAMDEAASLYAEALGEFARLPEPVFTDATTLAYQQAVAARVGPARCLQLHEAMLAQCARWLSSVEQMMTPEQLTAARAAVDGLRAKGWSIQQHVSA